VETRKIHDEEYEWGISVDPEYEPTEEKSFTIIAGVQS
jgi:hypothetical protein